MGDDDGIATVLLLLLVVVVAVDGRHQHDDTFISTQE